MDKDKISISFDVFVTVIGLVLVLSFLAGMLAGYWIEEGHSKFCPECGSRYGIDGEYCEHDGQKLKAKK